MLTTPKSIRNSLLAAAVALLAGPALTACMTDASAPTDESMFPAEDGWEALAEGVFERTLHDGTVQLRALGHEGLAWALPEIEAHGARLAATAERDPSAENIEALAAHEEMLAGVRRALDVSSKQQASGFTTLTGCNVDYGVNANAYPKNAGSNASASAHYSNTCSLIGSAYAYVQVAVGSSYRAETCGTINGSNVSCSVFETLSGTSDCTGYATAVVYDHNNAGFFASDSNSDCGQIEPPDPCDLYSLRGCDLDPPEM
ncbi:hypothetical protein [Haliangium sp.]|uniref:hypothetical protein n=1 Tax=Haliangium sp. TaxID=2663208 RepID=UPI003D14E484